MGLFSETWRTVTGKVSTSGIWNRNFRTSLYREKTIDYTRNDYDLYRSLYYGVSINGKASDMQIGAMFAKPIVNSTAGFALGKNFTVKLGEDKYGDAEQDINSWIDKNQSTILQFVIHGVRDGDSYLYIDEYGNLEEIDAKSVTVVLDPMMGSLIGYDVIERYSLTDTNNNEQKYMVIKNYRRDSVKYTQYPDNQADESKLQGGKVIYHRVYTSAGAVEPTENSEFYQGDIINRPLPIIHFANDVEPRQVYGNSELLNCLVGIRNYHAVVSNATKGVINNSNPIPVMKGVKNAEAIARQSNSGETEDLDKINWSPETILFLENPEADAKFIQANGFMDDTGKLLQYFFYLIVEASETPEFVFGTAVSSSKASVSEQMPVVVSKATRKRAQLQQPLVNLIESLIDRKIRMSDTLYLPLKNAELDITIEFPEIIDEDKAQLLETVKYLNAEGILSDETAMQLLLSEKIPDVSEELKNARKDNESQMDTFGAAPAETGRLQAELAAKDDSGIKSDKKTDSAKAMKVENKPVVEKQMVEDGDRDFLVGLADSEIISEYNKNHDKSGRFTFGKSSGGIGGTPTMAKYQKIKNDIQARVDSGEKVSDEEIFAALDYKQKAIAVEFKKKYGSKQMNLDELQQKAVGVKKSDLEKRSAFTKGKKLGETEALGSVYKATGTENMYRSVTLEDYVRIKKQGFINSDGRGAIAPLEEGTNFADNPKTALYYINKNTKSVVLTVKPDNLNLFLCDSDDYIRSLENVPIENIISVSKIVGKTESGDYYMPKEVVKETLDAPFSEVIREPYSGFTGKVIAEYNTNHDKLGRFTFGKSGGGSGLSGVETAKPNARIKSAPTSFTNKQTRDEYVKIVTEDSKRDGGITVPLSDAGSRPSEGLSFAPSKKTERMVAAKDFNEQAVKQFIQDNKAELSKPNRYVGNWYNEEDGNFYLDVAEVGGYSPKTIAKAQAAEQLAVFDLKMFNTIEVGKITEKGYNKLDEASTIYDKAFKKGDGRGTGSENISPVSEYYADENVSEKGSEEVISEYNKNHDKLGRFTFGKSGGSGSSSGKKDDGIKVTGGGTLEDKVRSLQEKHGYNKPITNEEKDKVLTEALGKDKKKQYDADLAEVSKKKTTAEKYGIYETVIIDGKETKKLVGFTKPRLKKHKEIIKYEKARMKELTPTEPPVLTIIGARAGAGKSSFEIRGEDNPWGDAPWATYSSKNAYVSNNDHIKELLGVKPKEVGLVHEESGFIQKQLDNIAFERRLNMVVDGTLNSDKSQMIQAYKDAGYKVQMAVVSSTPTQSLVDSGKRYFAVDEKTWNGFHTVNGKETLEPIKNKTGRLVAPEVSMGATRTEDNFLAASGLVDSFVYYRKDPTATEFKESYVLEASKGTMDSML